MHKVFVRLRGRKTMLHMKCLGVKMARRIANNGMQLCNFTHHQTLVSDTQLRQFLDVVVATHMQFLIQM